MPAAKQLEVQPGNARDQFEPREVAIRERMRELVATTWLKDHIDTIRDLQAEELRTAVTHARNGKTSCIRDLSQQVLHEVSTLYAAKLADDESLHLLRRINEGPVIITTNHFGLYKLFGIETQSVDAATPDYPRTYPYWAYIAGLYPLAARAGKNLSYFSAQFPGIFHDIHEASGFVHVPTTSTGGGLREVFRQVERLIQDYPETAVVCFPEGTTSGKPNGSDPYHLAPFKRGAYALAGHLGIPRLLVGQFLHPSEGLLLKVLDEPVVPQGEDLREVCGTLALEDQKKMQSWLDRMTQDHHPEILKKRVYSQ